MEESVREQVRKWADWALFLAATVSNFFATRFIGRLTDSEHVADLATLIIWMALYALIVFKPRLGYLLWLFAGFIAIIFMARFNPFFFRDVWATLNSDDLALTGAPVASFTLAGLGIVSNFLLVTSLVRAILCLLPLRQRIWPSYAVGFVFLAAWYLETASPYRIPGIVDRGFPSVEIVHIRKRGLRFEETGAGVSRDGRLWIDRTDRRLFEYQFEVRNSVGTASQATVDRARALLRSPEILALHTPLPKPLRAWNAEGWYVAGDGTGKILAFGSEQGTVPPTSIVDLFSEVVSLPTPGLSKEIKRDICFGFCFDPLASLGFVYTNQRPEWNHQNLW